MLGSLENTLSHFANSTEAGPARTMATMFSSDNTNNSPAKYLQKKVKSFRRYWKPVIASVLVALGSVVIGTTSGYSSMAIPNFNKHEEVFSLFSDNTSWFRSLLFLASIPGAVFSTVIIDRCGKKSCLVMASLPFLVGWIIIAFATDLIMMLTGRFISGMSLAIMQCSVTTYISDIAPLKIRGVLISFHEFGIDIGVLTTYIVGNFVNYSWLAGACIVIVCLHLAAMFFIPETPRWYLAKERIEEAKLSLRWFRDSSTDLEPEIMRIQASLIETSQPIPWCEFLRQPLLKWLLVSQSLYITQQFCCVNVIRSYVDTMFLTSDSHSDSHIEVIIVGASFIFGAIASMLAIDRVQDRTMLLFSSMFMLVGLSSTATVFLYSNTPLDAAVEAQIYCLPLVSITIICFGYAFGFGPLPLMVTTRLFAPNARGRATCMGLTTSCVFAFLMTKLFYDLRIAVGLHGVFYFCAAVCLVEFVVVYVFVPTANGISSQQTRSTSIDLDSTSNNKF